MADDNPALRFNIDKPLIKRGPTDLREDVIHFHKHFKLEGVVSVEQLIRGAFIAQDKANRYAFQEQGLAELTSTEEAALKAEDPKNPKDEVGFWRQTQDLKVTMLTTACAAIVQGWQQSSINATSQAWQAALHYDGDKSDWGAHQLLVGLVDAAPWLSASVVGTWLSDPLQEGGFGRRRALFISAIFCIASVLGSARCNSWQALLACRMLLGIGIGAKASIAPVLAAEVAAKNLRGRMLLLWQLFDALGIFLGFLAVWIVGGSWRVLLGAPAIPAIVLLFLVFLCPESPRFLIRNKEYAKAYQSLRRLKETDLQAARDLYDIHIRLLVETLDLNNQDIQQRAENGFRVDPASKPPTGEPHDPAPKPSIGSFPKRFVELWTKPRNRRACLTTFLVMMAQQMCGINVIAFYSSTLFGNDACLKNSRVEWMNFGFGLANFLFTLPAYHLIDTYGRRKLILYSLGGMFFTLLPLAVGLFELGKNQFKAREALIATFGVVVFTFWYGIGAGPVPFTLSAEVFPLAYREVGMSFSVMVNFLGLGLLVLLVPKVNTSLTKMEGGNWNTTSNCTAQNDAAYTTMAGQGILLFIFMGFNAVAFVLILFLVPSGTTARVSLESMNVIFNKRTVEHNRQIRWLAGLLRRKGKGVSEEMSMESVLESSRERV
ncbi:uncharacterized protein BP01DRAFT_358164 [Aspergillus saccharolyticus JOP 1030-1]|uniref:Major facilitator superfamily (MFS) profile domain-containing protein n=1 Tax=Aspergillus saccharolyticus JOP 1030-1 TaxID=1450539 RepID=A0A318Z9S2_9EURO|nr:hypothetical protein BP01DRAFT_358164 [Aspergillus saccharolyticus JOP 1030-1]PYH43989.1 hypothetical protein BP01DRAFT_358164 [Aspergillus saccharolyticus JOP 1030-1]